MKKIINLEILHPNSWVLLLKTGEVGPIDAVHRVQTGTFYEILLPRLKRKFVSTNEVVPVRSLNGIP